MRRQWKMQRIIAHLKDLFYVFFGRKSNFLGNNFLSDSHLELSVYRESKLKFHWAIEHDYFRSCFVDSLEGRLDEFTHHYCPYQ